MRSWITPTNGATRKPLFVTRSSRRPISSTRSGAMPTSSCASRTVASISVSPSSTAPPGNAIWPLCEARFSERREKRIDHCAPSRTSGTSTHARRCPGASISMAGRWPARSRSRASAASSKRIQRLRIEHRDGLERVVEAAVRGGEERDFVAGAEVAREIEPFVAAGALGDEAVRGLAVAAGFQRDVAGVAQRHFVAVVRGGDFGEERLGWRHGRDRHECLSSMESAEITLGGDADCGVLFEPAALGGGHVGELAGEEVGERVDFFVERNL